MTNKSNEISLPQILALDNNCICVVSKQKIEYNNISAITHISENKFGIGIQDKLIIYECKNKNEMFLFFSLSFISKYMSMYVYIYLI